MMSAPLSVLLAGASGYLGLHALEALLDAGHAVSALVRDTERLGRFGSADRVRVLKGDLEDPVAIANAVRGQDVCVHAALIWGEPGSEWRDTAATECLMNACGAEGVSRVVYVSSTAVHRPFSAVMRESDRIRTTEIYGATKAAGEAAAARAGASYGMQVVVVRPGPIVGPPAFVGGAFGSDTRLARIVEAVAAGRPFELPDAPPRQFVAVREVAALLAFVAISEESPSGTYLAVSGRHIAWADIAREASELIDGVAEGGARSSKREEAPWFDTSKLGAHGFSFDAAGAMREHLACLVRGELDGE